MPITKLNKYYLTVRLAKATIVILLLTILISVLLAVYYYFDSNDKNDKKPRVTSMINDAHHAAENLRFYGLDGNMQPYNILAAHAIQKLDKIIELDKVQASYTLKNNKNISIVSDRAILNADTNVLQLNGNIIASNDEYSLLAQNAIINYKETIAHGDSQVRMISKLGEIESHQFEIKDNYNTVKFFGSRVKTTLYPNSISEKR